MKCLSLLQPWASLCVTTDPATGKAYKQIETRSWNTKYRGPLLIHASKGYSKEQEAFAHSIYMNYGFTGAYHCDRGAIIGMVNLVDTMNTVRIILPPNETKYRSIIFDPWKITDQELAFGDYSPGRYGWLLSDPILFKTPIPCKGALSIWNLPVELEGAVQEQILLSKVLESEEVISTRSVTRHLSLNIAGFLRNNKGKDITGYLSDENGKEMTDADARKYLAECQAKGWKKIPCGDCDGFDYFDKGCPGHEEKPADYSVSAIASPGEGAVIVDGAESTPKTIGQLLTEAITLNELKAEVIEWELGFRAGIIAKLMNDEFYTNSVPVVLLKKLILSLHIKPSDVYKAMIPTHKVVIAKETTETIRRKHHGYQLWENEEAVIKYTAHLKEIFKTDEPAPAVEPTVLPPLSSTDYYNILPIIHPEGGWDKIPPPEKDNIYPTKEAMENTQKLWDDFLMR